MQIKNYLNLSNIPFGKNNFYSYVQFICLLLFYYHNTLAIFYQIIRIHYRHDISQANIDVLPRGCIIGAAFIADQKYFDYDTAQMQYACGPYCIIFGGAVAFDKTIEYSGNQGVRPIPDDIQNELNKMKEAMLFVLKIKQTWIKETEYITDWNQCKILGISQPFASLTIKGDKRIENRTLSRALWNPQSKKSKIMKPDYFVCYCCVFIGFNNNNEKCMCEDINKKNNKTPKHFNDEKILQQQQHKSNNHSENELKQCINKLHKCWNQENKIANQMENDNVIYSYAQYMNKIASCLTQIQLLDYTVFNNLLNDKKNFNFVIAYMNNTNGKQWWSKRLLFR